MTKQKIRDTFTEYLSKTGYISASSLKPLMINPARFRYEQLMEELRIVKGLKQQESPAQKIGSALHKLVLEPSEFTQEYTVFDRDQVLPFPDKDYRTKANQEARDNFIASNASKIVLDEAEMEVVQGMADSLLAHPTFPKLLPNTITELSHYFAYKDELYGETEINIRLRPDLLPLDNRPFFLSLKTTKDASPEGFAKECVKYGYYMKEPFYLDMLNYFYEGERRFDQAIMAVVENEAPYHCALYYLNDEFIEIGRHHYKAALHRYAQSLKTDIWPSYEIYAEDNSGLMPLSLPNYMKFSNVII